MLGNMAQLIVATQREFRKKQLSSLLFLLKKSNTSSYL